MKKLTSISVIRYFLFIFLLQALSLKTISQQINYHTKDDLNLLVSGTSTLHDWNMKGVKGDVNASFSFNAAGHITALNSLSVVTPTIGIKSEHGAMDKKAYKSLKSDKNPNISFNQISSTIVPIDANNYTVKSFGKLTIAGFTKDVELISNCRINADKSITVSGNRKISMKDYNMESPSWLFVKTGDMIELKFDLTIRK